LIDCADLTTPEFNGPGGVGISDFNGPKEIKTPDFKSLKLKDSPDFHWNFNPYGREVLL